MKVLFLDTVHESLQEELEKNGIQCELRTEEPKEAVARVIDDFDGVVIRSRIPMDSFVLQYAQNLKFIARSGAGMENIDTDLCEEMGIELFNAPEGNREAVAEHVIGMLLALFNKICNADREVRQGVWEREGNRGTELGEKTVGIIGFGNTGSALARKLSGFGCRILAFDKYKTGFGNGQVEEATLEKLLQEADVISFHVPLTEETRYFFDKELLGRLAHPVTLVNASRGEVVNTEALVGGLESGKINGACLDVLEYEKRSFEKLHQEGLPETFRKLVERKDVLLSPHVAGWTEESYRKLSEVLAAKVLAWKENHERKSQKK